MLLVFLVAFALGWIGSMPLAGPIAVMVVSRAVAALDGAALRLAVGAAVAEAMYAGVAFWGFAAFLARYPIVKPISQIVTAMVLLGIGTHFAVWRPKQAASNAERADNHRQKARPLILGFTITAFNPTLLVTWSAATAALYARADGLLPMRPDQALPFGVGAGLGVVSWFATLVALFRRYRAKFPQAVLTWLVRAMGLLLVGMGLWFAIEFVTFLFRRG